MGKITLDKIENDLFNHIADSLLIADRAGYKESVILKVLIEAVARSLVLSMPEELDEDNIDVIENLLRNDLKHYRGVLPAAIQDAALFSSMEH